jgi:hypothetical protein
MAFGLLFLGATLPALAAGNAFDRPPGEGPTPVSVFAWIVDVESVNSAEQEFHANVFVALRWKDPRLAHPGPPAHRDLAEVWHPRLQLMNEDELVRRGFPESVEVDSLGNVIYRQRYTGFFSQPLDLRDFPFDRQTLGLYFISVGYREDEIAFMHFRDILPDGVGMAARLSLPDWTVRGLAVAPQPVQVGPGIAVPGFSVLVHVSRNPQHYVWMVLVPLLLIVFMSWTVFWIDPTQSGVQIGVATTSMLTLIAYRLPLASEVPRVPYMTRLDTFMLYATVLVFLSLIQVILTSSLARRGQEARARRIDRVSRGIFPLAYLGTLVLTLFG